MSKGKGEIGDIFDQALKEGNEAALIHGISKNIGWAFKSKTEVVALQGADILAWEALHDIRRVHCANPGEARRKSFEVLISGPMDRSYHDRDSLRRFVHYVRTKTSATW